MANTIQNLSDSELIMVANQLVAAMSAAPVAYGTNSAQLSVVTGLIATFDTDVTAQMAAAAAAKTATMTKEASRLPLVDILRVRRDMAKASGATEAMMAATGLPSGGGTAPPTATVPMATVDTSERMRHTINWMDAASPDNKRRPRGAMGADIYVKLDGPPPTDASQCTFLTTDSATPYLAQYEGTDAGKMAHYMLRWRMRDGNTGPWSETISATITG